MDQFDSSSRCMAYWAGERSIMRERKASIQFWPACQPLGLMNALPFPSCPWNPFYVKAAITIEALLVRNGGAQRQRWSTIPPHTVILVQVVVFARRSGGNGNALVDECQVQKVTSTQRLALHVMRGSGKCLWCPNRKDSEGPYPESSRSPIIALKRTYHISNAAPATPERYRSTR